MIESKERYLAVLSTHDEVQTELKSLETKCRQVMAQLAEIDAMWDYIKDPHTVTFLKINYEKAHISIQLGIMSNWYISHEDDEDDKWCWAHLELDWLFDDNFKQNYLKQREQTETEWMKRRREHEEKIKQLQTEREYQQYLALKEKYEKAQ